VNDVVLWWMIRMIFHVLRIIMTNKLFYILFSSWLVDTNYEDEPNPPVIFSFFNYLKHANLLTNSEHFCKVEPSHYTLCFFVTLDKLQQHMNYTFTESCQTMKFKRSLNNFVRTMMDDLNTMGTIYDFRND